MDFLMTKNNLFKGFSKNTLQFFMELSIHNTKQWFDDHRKDYEDFVLEPSKSFVDAMGMFLKKISPQVQAIPKVNQSLFRINRDTRFSSDKSPYKTQLGILFWEGNLSRTECSGYYFHVEPNLLMIAAGIHIFSKPILESYRQSVIHEKHGMELVKIVTSLNKQDISLGGKHYKKIPRGFDPQHERAEYLLYNGLHCMIEQDIPEEFYSERLIEYCYSYYSKMRPLHDWIVEMTHRVE